MLDSPGLPALAVEVDQLHNRGRYEELSIKCKSLNTLIAGLKTAKETRQQSAENGGEPFLHPDITSLLDYASQRLPSVVLTNGMLLRRRRLEGLARLAGRSTLTIQTSLDGACAQTHDAHRGAGSWARTLDGIRQATALGLPVRVALTQTPENTAEIPKVASLLASLGVPPEGFAVRPLLRRGLSPTGLDIGADTTIPELTVSTDGLHWHPAGADAATSPDMLLAGPGTPLAAGKRLVAERFFTARLADGSLPRPYQCAI